MRPLLGLHSLLLLHKRSSSSTISSSSSTSSSSSAAAAALAAAAAAAGRAAASLSGSMSLAPFLLSIALRVRLADGLPHSDVKSVSTLQQQQQQVSSFSSSKRKPLLRAPPNHLTGIFESLGAPRLLGSRALWGAPQMRLFGVTQQDLIGSASFKVTHGSSGSSSSSNSCRSRSCSSSCSCSGNSSSSSSSSSSSKEA
ncbi:hypothetical protein Emed_003512 [Eimeria media]